MLSCEKTLLLTLVLCFGLCGTSAQNLLPRPQKAVYEKGFFDTRNTFVIQPSTNSYPSENLSLWKQTIIDNKDSASPTQRRVIFQKNDALKSEEAYTVEISKDTILINAKTSFGFFYAQNTLLQLLNKKGKIPCGRIEDSPAYTWRGAMIDVSRHFYPIDFLKRQIDVMAFYKLNRLHLHLTDAAGWRIEIKRYPRLTQLAAWRTDALWKSWWNGERKYTEQGAADAYGGYYTQQELKDLVKYAEQRNITIIPEIEMPAHSEEVLTAYPELSCTHEPYKQADFCPGSIATYDFLEHVLQEVLEIFPSPYIHIGGDEAGKASWASCPRCQQKMKEEGIQDLKGLQTYLIRRIGNFLNQQGRYLIGWDEIVDDHLPEGTHVMIWRDQENARKAIQKGYDVILSPGAHCYFDAYQDDPSTQQEAIGGFLTLEKAYQLNPQKGLSAKEQIHIKGVQGNLWTEYVPTEAHAEYMLYPRLLAIAEIGWYGATHKNFNDFRKRAIQETDRLRSHGINAFDLHREIGDRPESLRPQQHKALQAEIIYNRPVSPYYKGNGKRTLIDGQLGGWNYGDGRWQGFIGSNYLDITLDLKKTQTIRKISTDFLQCSRPDIFYPAIYQISISNDGQHFEKIYEKTHKVSHLPLVATDYWIWKGKQKARFVRIEARNGKKGGWIFTDEIQIF